MTKEQKFLSALRDVFIGERIEGKSGQINLMRIKARYYEMGIFPRLIEEIEKELARAPKFREELFDKLFSFFSRYFSENGSILFRHTPLHQNIYERVYTDDKDVFLFWKTHMLHYVKTDQIFQSIEVPIDGCRIAFDVSSLEHKKANERRDLAYKFKGKRKDGPFVLEVVTAGRGIKTDCSEILRQINAALKIAVAESALLKAIRVFERQCEVDYFINKDAKAFLEEQFDLWMYQYVFKGENKWSQARIDELQILKKIALKIILFIGQFESELLRIWSKPKFVLNSNYVISFDRIPVGHPLIKKVVAHKNFKQQIGEWQSLGMVSKSFKAINLWKKGRGNELASECKTLPIDTKFFKDLESEFLSIFENHCS